MEPYTYFFILLLCLFLGMIGLYVPLIGFLGLIISVTVIIPQIPALITDSEYMIFSILVVIGCIIIPLAGFRRDR